jgi:hypothetical protein
VGKQQNDTFGEHWYLRTKQLSPDDQREAYDWLIAHIHILVFNDNGNSHEDSLKDVKILRQNIDGDNCFWMRVNPQYSKEATLFKLKWC